VWNFPRVARLVKCVTFQILGTHSFACYLKDVSRVPRVKSLAAGVVALGPAGGQVQPWLAVELMALKRTCAECDFFQFDVHCRLRDMLQRPSKGFMLQH
jgi:hypothetical protein